MGEKNNKLIYGGIGILVICFICGLLYWYLNKDKKDTKKDNSAGVEGKKDKDEGKKDTKDEGKKDTKDEGKKDTKDEGILVTDPAEIKKLKDKASELFVLSMLNYTPLNLNKSFYESAKANPSGYKLSVDEYKRLYDESLLKYKNSVDEMNSFLIKYKPTKLLAELDGKICYGPDFTAKYNFKDGLCVLGS